MFKRWRRSNLLLLAVASLSVAMLPQACGGSNQSGAAGEECFRDADCVEGLVCVEGACSNDVTPLVPEPRERPASGDGGANGAAATGAGGSGVIPAAGGSGSVTTTTTTGMGGGGTTVSGAGGSGIAGTSNQAGAEGAE